MNETGKKYTVLQRAYQAGHYLAAHAVNTHQTTIDLQQARLFTSDNEAVEWLGNAIYRDAKDKVGAGINWSWSLAHVVVQTVEERPMPPSVELYNLNCAVEQDEAVVVKYRHPTNGTEMFLNGLSVKLTKDQLSRDIADAKAFGNINEAMGWLMRCHARSLHADTPLSTTQFSLHSVNKNDFNKRQNFNNKPIRTQQVVLL